MREKLAMPLVQQPMWNCVPGRFTNHMDGLMSEWWRVVQAG
jgi:hypothetical protein